MVKSGLEDRFHGDADVPRVSQYRLAAHLGSAFVLYSLFLWTSLHHLVPAKVMEVSKAAIKFKRLVHFSKGIVFLTAISGTLSFTIINGKDKNTANFCHLGDSHNFILSFIIS